MMFSAGGTVGLTGKLSHFIRAGSIVHSVDGSMYFCTSKLASSGESRCRFTDLQGKPVTSLQAGWHPISPALARFAAWVRLAYNKDFDLYVKEYIREAGLPIDPTMNWSRFFEARVVPKLISKDPEVQDEAIHHIIIKTLAERSALANFSGAIKKFPERIQELPLARQVTVFLMQTFNWRVMEANEYIKKFVFQNNTDSMWAEGEEEGEDRNLLDTENRADSGVYNISEADIDIAKFRRGFADWLARKKKPEGAEQFLHLFDLLYEITKTSDEPIRPRFVLDDWWHTFSGAEDKPLTEKARTLFTNLWDTLPVLIDRYIEILGNNYRVQPFLEIMRNLGKRKKELPQKTQLLQPAMASFKLADEFPINHDIDTTPSSGSSDNNSGGSGLNLPSMGEEAEGVSGALEELAPLALAASKNASQWEVPTCRSCGSTKGATDCPACSDKFCADCILTHHSNNPSHDRVN